MSGLYASTDWCEMFGTAIYGGENELLAVVSDELDAKVFAAAPNLLLVVKNLVHCMDAEPKEFHPMFITQAKSALAKAEGNLVNDKHTRTR